MTYSATQDQSTQPQTQAALFALAPGDLPKVAEVLFGKTDRAHWSRKVIVLGRITDEKVYAELCPSAEEWAKANLDIVPSEYRLAMSLFRLMQKGYGAKPQIPYESWEQLSRQRALLFKEIAGVAGEDQLAGWFIKAAEADTTEAFEHEVRRFLKEQPMTWLRFRVPSNLPDVLDAAFLRVLPEVLTEDELARVHEEAGNESSEWHPLNLISRDPIRARCIEMVAVHVCQTLDEHREGPFAVRTKQPELPLGEQPGA